MAEAEKVCTKCHIAKPVDAFAVCRRNLFGRQSACRDCRRMYYAADLDKIRERSTAYYWANREAMREKGRLRYERNREAVSIQGREKYYRDVELSRERARLRTAANPELKREIQRRRRVRKLGMAAVTIRPADLLALLVSFENRCVYCRADLSEGYHFDHRVPLSKGGEHSLLNLVPACRWCNRSKHDRMLSEWLPGRFD